MRPLVALSAFLDVSSLNLAVPQAPPFLSGASPSRRMLGQGHWPCGPRLLTKGPGEDILRGRAKPRSAGAITRQRVLAIGRGRGAGSIGAWRSPLPLAGRDVRPHAPGMFVVSEAEAAAIRAVFDQRGELSAAIELRRLFPGITDIAQARECARTIAGWKPLPVAPRLVRRCTKAGTGSPEPGTTARTGQCPGRR